MGTLPPSSLQREFDTFPFGLAVWDQESRLLYCNRAFRDLYHHVDAPLEPGLSFASLLQEMARSNEHSIIGAAEDWADRQVAAFERGETIEQELADGRSYEICHSRTQSGGAVMLTRDVTVQKRAERALRQAKELAEAADEAKSRFLRAANHDLRQPLATLKLLIHSCAGEADESHRQDLLHAMDISVAIMEDLLGALLQIGQLDAGKIVPRIGTFQISQILERIRIQYGHQAEEKALRLRIVNSSVAVRSDRTLVERILSNFVANAIRYTDVGSVLVGCRRLPSAVRVEVWDSGHGIAEEHLERIFDEFYQVEDSAHKRRRGLGLGLNISKRLAALLNHEIRVRSTPGRGTVFSLELPLGDVWQSDLGEPEISERIGGEFADLSVLVIEDDELLRSAMLELLERWGIEVHAVSGVEGARSLVAERTFTPGLIIADYSLRGTHGTDIARWVGDNLGAEIPSIIVTADTEPKLIAEIKEQGFPVLIKPISPPRLRVLMHSLLYEP